MLFFEVAAVAVVRLLNLSWATCRKLELRLVKFDCCLVSDWQITNQITNQFHHNVNF